jgi:hypothetical protein|tara:strand:+ start:128 stop:535 length:408 start_codon:yes stop_codon:yes gene_type:complete
MNIFFKTWNERKFDLPNYESKLKEERKLIAMKVINPIEREKGGKMTNESNAIALEEEHDEPIILNEEEIKDVLHKWDYIDEVSFSLLNSPLRDTLMGDSTLIEDFKEFYKAWKLFRKKIETYETLDTILKRKYNK